VGKELVKQLRTSRFKTRAKCFNNKVWKLWIATSVTIHDVRSSTYGTANCSIANKIQAQIKKPSFAHRQSMLIRTGLSLDFFPHHTQTIQTTPRINIILLLYTLILIQTTS
jgi:hypothetical protein